MDILPNTGLRNWAVRAQRIMATAAMGLGQFQRFLSCDHGTGLHTCDLGIVVHKRDIFIYPLIDNPSYNFSDNFSESQFTMPVSEEINTSSWTEFSVLISIKIRHSIFIASIEYPLNLKLVFCNFCYTVIYGKSRRRK